MPSSLTKVRTTQSMPVSSERRSSVNAAHTHPPADVTCRSPEMLGMGATPQASKKFFSRSALLSAAACQLPPRNIATRPAYHVAGLVVLRTEGRDAGRRHRTLAATCGKQDLQPSGRERLRHGDQLVPGGRWLRHHVLAVVENTDVGRELQ